MFVITPIKIQIWQQWCGYEPATLKQENTVVAVNMIGAKLYVSNFKLQIGTDWNSNFSKKYEKF